MRARGARSSGYDDGGEPLKFWFGDSLMAQKRGAIFHTPLLFFGGAEGDRTPDLMNAIHARSQLRHSPITCTTSID